jgi:hypothetical protein
VPSAGYEVGREQRSRREGNRPKPSRSPRTLVTTMAALTRA